jgi:putative ABC transport system permease protein
MEAPAHGTACVTGRGDPQSMTHVLSDIRHGARLFLRRPGLAIVATLTLALGIGANSAIFSVIRAVLIEPLPYRDAESLVVVWSRWVGFDKTWLSDAELLDYRRDATSLAAIGGWSDTAVNLTGGGEPERVGAALATAGVFRALGTTPLLGRTFTEDEDRPGHDLIAVIGYGLWQRRFGGDPAIVNKTIEVNGVARTIVGVMPAGFMLPFDFREPDPSQIWMPLAIDTADLERGSHGLLAVARLAPGATAAQASAELKTITDRRVNEGLYPRPMQFEAFAVPLDREILGQVRPALVILVAAVAALLLIACANVTNLLLAHAEERQREVAVRIALGAGRRDLLRQTLAEGLVLAMAGAAAALALALIGIRVVAAWPLTSIPRLATVTVDWRVIAFTGTLALGVSLVLSLIPALHAGRLELTQALKDGAAAATPSRKRQRIRQVLIAGQMAAAVVLLVCTALMVRSLWALQRIDPGFRPAGVLTLRLSLPQASYEDPERVVGFYEELLDRVRRLPGVTEAGAVRSLPLANTIGDWGLQIEGYVPPPGTQAKGDWQVATPGYLEAIGERLVAGRTFTHGDTTSAPQVALVNQTMAGTYWPGQDPIGRRIRQGGNPDPDRPWVTVVGVVADVRHNGINAIVKEKFYRPHSQFHVSSGNPVRQMTLVVKAGGDPLRLVPDVRAAVRSVDPNVPIAAVRTMDEVVASTIAEPRFAGWLLGIFSALAMTLAAIGVYGVLAYFVGRGTREIGVRMALGAAPRQIAVLVVSRGLGPCLAGMAAGLVAAFGAANVMASQLFGVRAMDPVTFASVPLALLLVGLLAACVPARRATKVDPLSCLRME